MQISAFRIVPSDHLKTLVRLNIGCGLEKVGGFVNIDEHESVEPDLVKNLRFGGGISTDGFHLIPFLNDSVAEIRSFGFLQRMNTPGAFLDFMNECHRVLDPEGTAVFRVPNALSQAVPGAAISDPMHRMLFTSRTFDYLTEGTEQYEGRGKLDGFKPWRLANLFYLDGDATIQVTLQPVKESTQ